VFSVSYAIKLVQNSNQLQPLEYSALAEYATFARHRSTQSISIKPASCIDALPGLHYIGIVGSTASTPAPVITNNGRHATGNTGSSLYNESLDGIGVKGA